MKAVTYSAARRRFEHRTGRRICKLGDKERYSLQASYALLENNFVRDAGDLQAVERWCREAGVLHEGESLVAT